MTTQQLILIFCAYLAGLGIVIYLTRATVWRIAGAVAGGAAVGLMGLGVIAFGNALGLWLVTISWVPHFLVLLYLALSISMAPIYLVTWRVARRFGRRGLTAFLGLAAVIGPPRDYLIAALCPEWMNFATGIAPMLTIAVFYAGAVVLGHAVMRLISGPSCEDQLARRPWESA
jgi:hypothetical protein